MQINDSPVISQLQREQVVAETHAWIEKASDFYNREFEPVQVTFDLKGRTSGMFCRRNFGLEGTRQWIRYNPWIFAKYFEESITNTVPHEVAHYICSSMYESGIRSRKIRPHGREWKDVMAKFRVPAKASCSLDISDIPQKRLRRFTYQCSCRLHELTSIRHNRIVQGKSNYACPLCKTALQPANHV